MSISVTTDVFCDKCNNWEHGVTGNRVKSRLARNAVKQKGWTKHIGSGSIIDLCPHCSKK
jgi:hypothetical protein